MRGSCSQRSQLFEFPKNKRQNRSPDKRTRSFLDRVVTMRKTSPQRQSLCAKPIGDLNTRVLRPRLRLAAPPISAYAQCPPGTKLRTQLLRKLSRTSSAERGVRQKRGQSAARASCWLSVCGSRVTRVRPLTSFSSRCVLPCNSSVEI